MPTIGVPRQRMTAIGRCVGLFRQANGSFGASFSFPLPPVEVG